MSSTPRFYDKTKIVDINQAFPNLDCTLNGTVIYTITNIRVMLEYVHAYSFFFISFIWKYGVDKQLHMFMRNVIMHSYRSI